MDRRTFTQRIASEVRVKLGTETRVQVVQKEDRCYEGLSLRKTVSAVADLDHFYAELEEKTYDEVFDEVIALLTQPVPFNAEWVKDWGYAEDKLFVSLVPQKQKRPSVGRDYGDLYMEVRVLVSADGGLATCLVTSELADLWQVEEDELFDLAFKNTEKIMPATVCTLTSAVGMSDNDVPAYIVSTEQQVRGAIAIFYDSVQADLYDKLGDYIAIPSSKNEFIVFPFKETKDIDHARKMLRDVNRTVVSAEDFLSDEVYVYSHDKLVCATMGVPA